MSDWNARQYLKFKNERTQPAIDLAMRIRTAPETIVDIGCGPGNSTKILRELFPKASILGIDSSPHMIERAKKDHPDLDFCVCDALSLDRSVDLIYSNACLHWIPNHQTFLPALMRKLNDGGMLAVQMPYNNEEPLYRMINEMTADPRWGFDSAKIEHNTTLSPDEYYEILSGCSSFDIWETKYYHSMPDHQALVEWVKSAKLRPYLDILHEDDRQLFEAELVAGARKAYPVMPDGNIVFGFRRLFFTAAKP